MNTTAPALLPRTTTRAPRRHGIAAAALGCAIALGGCAVAPLQPRFIGGVVVNAPPPAQAEAIGTAPTLGDVWVSGDWSWTGGGHVWIPGHWTPPRVGPYWVPHVWVHTHHDSCNKAAPTLPHGINRSARHWTH